MMKDGSWDNYPFHRPILELLVQLMGDRSFHRPILESLVRLMSDRSFVQIDIVFCVLWLYSSNITSYCTIVHYCHRWQMICEWCTVRDKIPKILQLNLLDGLYCLDRKGPIFVLSLCPSDGGDLVIY